MHEKPMTQRQMLEQLMLIVKGNGVMGLVELPKKVDLLATDVHTLKVFLEGQGEGSVRQAGLADRVAALEQLQKTEKERRPKRRIEYIKAWAPWFTALTAVLIALLK